MWEKIKNYLKERPWLTGILLAIPAVVIIWFIQRRKGIPSEEYQAAGMIYQPPAGGGGGGGVSGGESSDSSIATMLTDFLQGISQQQEAQSKQLREFLLAEAESQKNFMESQNEYIEDIINIVSKSKSDTSVVMPEIPQPPIKEQREIYSPASSFKIPTGPVRVTDMPGATEDERWKQFEQTIAYDYLGSIAREAQTKVANLGAQWWSAKTPQEKAKIHQQAELERQRIYQEITRGGAGFTASWYDTGVGHKKLKITTPKGEVIDI